MKKIIPKKPGVKKSVKAKSQKKTANPISEPSFSPMPDKSLPAENVLPPPENPNTSIASPRTFNESNRYYYVLNQVIDPEAGIGIVDMGLIYNVTEKDGVLLVTMTLTSMGCPAGPQLTTDVDGVLRLQDGVKDVEIQVVWEPPWNPDMMNPEIRAMMFGGF